MKNSIVKLIALSAALLSTTAPAFASNFTGPRVETGVVFNGTNVTNSDTQLNVGVGYDTALSPTVRAGIDGFATGPFTDQRELGVTGRLGVVVAPQFLLYGKAGYANRKINNTNLNGVTYGAGAEFAVSNNLFVKGEYRRTNYEERVNGNTGIVGFGVRF